MADTPDPVTNEPADSAGGEPLPEPAVHTELPAESSAPADPPVPAPPAGPDSHASAAWLPAAKLDLPLTAALGVLLFVLLSPFIGVWEPWEAQQAVFASSLREGGHILLAELPKLSANDTARYELPWSMWPTRITLKLLGENELGLRLPSALAGLGALLVLMAVTRSLWGRLAGWLAVLGACGAPLFLFHGRQSLGGGLDMALLGMATLAWVYLMAVDAPGPRWRWGAHLATAGAALCMGLVGLGVPLVAGFVTWAMHGEARPALRPRLGLPFSVSLGLVLAGWGLAASALPDANGLVSLLLLSEPYEGLAASASWPTFDRVTHQLGYGLYPLGCLLPFAFGRVLWGDPEPDEVRGAYPAELGLAAAFAAAFIGVALPVPLSDGALFPGALLVAAVVGIYLARAARRAPEPLLAIAAAFVLMLVDHGLKHEPKALADALVLAKVDTFPPDLAFWWVKRVLSAVLIGLLLFYQAGVWRAVVPVFRFIAYPSRALRPVSWWLLGPLIAVAIGVAAARPDWLLSFAAEKFWGPLNNQARQLLILLPCVVVLYLALWFGIRWRARRVDGRTDGPLTASLERLVERVTQPRIAALSLVAVLGLWVVFVGGVVAFTLAAHFSQKQIVQAYERFAQGDAPLFKYRVDAKGASFYTRALTELTPPQFKEKANGAERVFAIIPRAQLASINGEFRAAAQGRTLPVLDASSFRFLLVSNQLADGETDENPIKRALVTELPKDKARPSKVNFDDQIELVGWYIDPPNPKPGTRIEISLYWKALKKPTRNWKVFVHVDGSGARIHGDHDPVEGLYPATNWNPGDIIRDVHSTEVKSEKASGRYTVWVGLYSGDTRAPVKAGDKDNENRAKLGVLDVR